MGSNQLRQGRMENNVAPFGVPSCVLGLVGRTTYYVPHKIIFESEITSENGPLPTARDVQNGSCKTDPSGALYHRKMLVFRGKRDYNRQLKDIPSWLNAHVQRRVVLNKKHWGGAKYS